MSQGRSAVSRPEWRAALPSEGLRAMDELREDSILFSLKGLFERERERVTDEANREYRRIEAEQLARLERERQEWEERERRRQEEETEVRREAQRRREADARLEALRGAELARARAEADGKARIELEAKQREHVLRLEGIREKSGRRLAEQLAASVVAIAVVLVAAGAWAYLGRIRPEQERMRVGYERMVVAERARSERIERLLEASERQNRELVSRLERMKRELAEARVMAAGAGPRPEPPAARRARMARSDSKPRTPCGDDRDPLNACLP